MANYVAGARTNYFEVKDVAAFKADFAKLEVQVITPAHGTAQAKAFAEGTARNVANMVGLLSIAECGWPTFVHSQDGEDEAEVNVAEMVAGHLVPGEVAVFMEAGSEGSRYLVGTAEFITADGRTGSISLQDIYAMAAGAAGAGRPVTMAEY